MFSHYNQNNSSPTNEQKLLLQAALWQGEAAINSWQTWRKTVNIDDIDRESYRLLPLVYRNLSAHNVTDSHLGRLKGVYRRTWVENQVLFQEIASILDALKSAGIETMLLKDAALNLYYYQDYGLRTIENFDFLIRTKDVLNAIPLLEKLDWKIQGNIANPKIPFTHIVGFKKEPKQYLNLRWHLFGEGFNENAENQFWQSAILTQVNNLPVYVLSPTEQLLYTCGSGIFRNSVSPVRRLVDAAIAIYTYPDRINWHHLIELAENYRLLLPLKTQLIQLSEILNAPIPASILLELENLPVSQMEQEEYQVLTGEKTTILERLKMRYFQYLRISKNAQFNLIGFLHYLQYVWGLENLWEVPIQVTSRTIQRIGFKKT
ncbi:nucleotidyltransferase family protein [Aerosakkonemataceae cyanobacterium BLCC-F154]|uniref:Nucleotidyltransferase family protein n=1 Tax=Floridaenema fluviatile BLCC-F154 TaxID=3153640 RepID=A0ABV4YK92_9CYAN